RAVCKRNDFDRDTVVSQVHYQRRQHIGGFDSSRHQGLFNFRPTAELEEIKQFGSASLDLLRHCRTGNGQREVSGNRKSANLERFWLGIENAMRQKQPSQKRKRRVS